MLLLFAKILIGMLVGILVGLTGLGGGVLLLPILIFMLGVPPLIAVGSDAVFNALTKIGVGVMHWRRGTVNWRLVLTLWMGSIPGACSGVLLLSYLRSTYGSGVNHVLRVVIGVLLIAIPTFLFLEMPVEKYVGPRQAAQQSSYKAAGAMGLVAGFLVGLTSVGSGSIIMVLLLMFVPCSPATLVGTDIIHAFGLTTVTSFLHLHLGTVNSGLVFPLLIGSVPGSLLGVRLSTVLPGHWLKRLLCVVLLATGARMLWV